MKEKDYSSKELESIIFEIDYDINLLYGNLSVYTRNQILSHLKGRVFMLEATIKTMNQSGNLQKQPLTTKTEDNSKNEPSIPLKSTESKLINKPVTTLEPEVNSIAGKAPVMLEPSLSGNQKTYTLQELSKFDGKNGNPAYVAVNGNVYDVTNNAAWAAATHFGLIAGKDLTKEFASCHAGQTILSKLKLVGKLV